MGIPGLFRYLKPTLRKDTLQEYPPNEVNNLFLDFNGIIHGQRENTFKYGGTEKEMYRNILIYVEHMVELIKPDQLLYIAVDGVCPRAKMQQQRRRRYKSQQDRVMAPKKDEKDIQFWDSNAITPGTQFMSNLDKELYFSTYLKELSRTIKVIISNSSVQGEGEQKIFKYLRQLSDTDEDSVHVIHGLDADLIMLSMIQHPQKIYLYREDTEKKTHNFLSIRNLYETIQINHPNISTQEYIVLAFLMGNDFLPKHYALNLRQNALDTVLMEFDYILNKSNDNLVKNGKINKAILLLLLKRLSTQENKLVKERADYMVYKNATRHGNSPQERFDYWPDYHRDMEVEINFGEMGWRDRYYNIIGCETNIQDMCKQYVNGLAWNLRYYTAKDPTHDCDQGWYYPYIHAPLLNDIVSYLENNDIILPLSNKEYTPLEQLAVVLPPQSNILIPVSWRSYVWNHDTDFPKKFKLDPIGCIFRWECPPILNKFDEQRIFEDLKRLKISRKEHRRSFKHKDYEVKY